ncbi:MAG: hypothetical protein KDE22_03525 [Rhodobacterales bacterium]|nr:hypothetical protein [Rhodobacterales bacterium]
MPRSLNIQGLGPLAVAALLAAAGAGAAQADPVRVTDRDCRRLARHVPAPNVAYRPGVDAHGRPVVPADVEGQPRLKGLEDVVVDLHVDLGDRLGLGAGGDYKGEIPIGQVKVRPDGTVTLNGQPLAGDDRARLLDACRNR